MSFIVGTDTYISLADARTYITRMGLTALPTNDAAAEQLLTQASFNLDKLYGSRYLGTKSTLAQTLAWPRLFAQGASQPHGTGEWLYQTYDSYGNARDFTGLQPETGQAATELALMIQAGDDINAQPVPRANFIKQKLNGLEEEIHTTDSNSYQENPLYTILLILGPILRNSTGSISITRGA